MCKILDYQNFPHKYKENINFCASLYLKVLNKSLKDAILVIKMMLQIKMDLFNSVKHLIMYSYYAFRIIIGSTF